MANAEIPRPSLSPRAKIGLLVPARNSTVETESHALCPPGVTNHVARMTFAGIAPDADPAAVKIGALDLDIHGAIDRVKYVLPDLILLGHSHDSFKGGVAGGRGMEEGLADYAGLPFVAPSIAYVAAIEALGIRDVAILTPYLTADDGLVRDFFADAGCTVRRVKGLQYDIGHAIAATDPSVVRDSLKDLDGDDVDAILQCGTNLPAARVAAEAEFWLRKPVLSVNVVTYWRALRRLGIDDQRDDFGVLLKEH